MCVPPVSGRFHRLFCPDMFLQSFRRILRSSVSEPKSPHVLINAYCTVSEPPDLPFTHKLISCRTLVAPEFAPHLDDVVGLLYSRRGAVMTSKLYQCIRHVQRTQVHLCANIETSEFRSFSEWARGANAIVIWPDSTVRDPIGRLLVSATTGDSLGTDGEVPFPEEAQARRERVLEGLAKCGLHVPRTLPPVVSVRELTLFVPRVRSHCAHKPF
ncbi:hypothetical protein PAN31117_05267 [Pandoraea anapnoica]|uniref:Uncharacterized protein n=1 Tax=Pandoraea anapnoica TaxID=2508301 RepID=A0A5E5AQ36_9BURK|nr:hypothetical protein PIN31009_05465 [Pandoraea iniqua]VVE75849.1 hypothetical protein PAN31117_05267 [Pandoraea anapnoica]